MAPLVIILPTVVVVIVLAVGLGLRHIKKGERADLAGDRPAGRGRASAGQDDEWRAPRQRPSAQRPASRAEAARRASREDRDKNSEVVQLKGRPDQRAKQSKSKRSDDDGDWPSTEWDDLSDADYWKEVASDRPLVTTARMAAPESPAARPIQAPRPVSDALPAASAEATARQAQDAQTLLQPVTAPQRESRRGGSRRDRASRDRASHDRASHDDGLGLPDHSSAPTGGPQRAAAGTGAGYGAGYLGAPPASPVRDLPQPVRDLPRPAQHRPAMPAMPAASMEPAGRSRTVPAPLDDDPLTSPSFPKIVVNDSRSYHSSRSGAASAAPAPDRADYSGPATAIFPRYGSPALQAGNGDPAGYLPAAPTGSTAPYSYTPAGHMDPRQPNGYDRSSYDHDSGSYDRAGTNASSGLSASYSLPSQPGTSYDSTPGMVNGYGHAGPDTGSSQAVPDTAAAYAASLAAQYPDHEAPSDPPAGNPYGSYVSSSGDYVSTDLPGYTPSLASAYPPGQPATSYLPGPPAARASDPYAQDYPPAAPSTDSWYPSTAGAAATSGAYPGPAIGAEPASAEYDQPGYSGRHHDAPSYGPAGYDGPGSAPGYLPPGGHAAGQQDTAAYLPPDYYGHDGRGDQARW